MHTPATPQETPLTAGQHSPLRPDSGRDFNREYHAMTTTRHHRFTSRLRAGFLLAVLLFSSATVSADDIFPAYDCLKPNIAFWEDIYSRYPLTQGVIHDSKNLGLVYEVIDLLGENEPDSQKINRERSKQTQQKYQSILTRLATGERPETADEKRVRGLFGDKATSQDYLTAVNNLRMQQGQKDRFREGLIRSGAYLETIQQAFRNQGLPEDLAYLAHVESSFNVKAYSKFGAAGIWQFTRSTGKRFMQIDYTVDERRDPYRATDAAATYLKENYQRLGNWPLALTAYNHGANGMARARQQLGDYPEIFKKYESPLFGFASRNFYSEFLAARQVAKNYRRYFGELRLDRPQPFYEIKMEKYASLPELADHFRLDLATIAELNPALRQPLFNGQKFVPPGYLLRLPARGDRMAALAKAMPGDLYQDNQKPSRFYEVQRGDSAGIIAKRLGVSLRELAMANQLNSQTTVYVGQNLRIPAQGENMEPPAAKEVTAKTKPVDTPPRVMTATNKIQVSRPAPATVAKPTVTAPVVTPPQTAKPATSPKIAPIRMAATHAPKMQDSFQAIETSPATGDEKMAVPPNQINPGVVYGHLKVEKVTGKGKTRMGTIRVEAGETLGHYAEWLDIRAKDLRQLNGLRFGATLHLDQQLQIPLHVVNRDQFEERRFEYHKEIEEDFFAAYRIEEMRNYRVKKGDNIWLLSNNEFEVPFWLLKKYNSDKDFDGLKPNQQLLVPVVETISERLSSPRRPPLPSG